MQPKNGPSTSTSATHMNVPEDIVGARVLGVRYGNQIVTSLLIRALRPACVFGVLPRALFKKQLIPHEDTANDVRCSVAA